MSWFDILMSTALRKRGNLLKEEYWRQIGNWAAKYSDIAQKRGNFVLNDFISGFSVGKTYEITPSYYDTNNLPQTFYFLDNSLENNEWVRHSSTYFTTTVIRNDTITFTVEEGHYYLLWTNKRDADLQTFIDRIESITVTEV